MSQFILVLLVATITYISTYDGTSQPALFYAPPTAEPVPLLVALHTWGGDYQQATNYDYANWSIAHNWAFIAPNFRGPNNNPTATGSPAAVQDIIDAVEYAQANANIDPERIYLLGGSGGGHAALLVAAQHPGIFKAASVWVPITDLATWHHQTAGTVYDNYAQNIVASTGGIPGTSPTIDAEYATRSPLTYLTNTLTTTIIINVGIFDGHTGSVPVSHSLLAFNAMVAEDSLSSADIDYITNSSQLPPALRGPAMCVDDTMILFSRTSNNARLNIFNGTHELRPVAALGQLWRIDAGQPEQAAVCPVTYLPVIQKLHSE